MKKCIVNYATKNSWYPFGQKRLNKSLENSEWDVLLFDQEFQCPNHNEIPYAFKLFCIQEANKRGYDVVLWLDASFWAIHDLKGLFEKIKEQGFLAQSSSYSLGVWTSDDCLDLFNIDRDGALNIPMFSGGLLGVDFAQRKDFFDEFFDYAVKGRGFKGSWTNRNNEVSQDPRVKGHRHDMSVGSIIALNHGLKFMPNNSLFCYYGWYEQYKDTIDLSSVYFVCEGGEREIS